MSEAESEALALALIWKSERDQAILERNQEREACAMYAERSGRFAEQADKLQRERDQARQEADRLRHGLAVEGDFVCPNEYAVSELTAERNFLRALKKNHEEDFTRVCKERDEARAEVERLHLDVGCLQLGLTVTSEAYRAGYMAGSRDAYRRGAEAMREACAREASVCANHRGEELADILSALPIPEEP